MTEKNDTHGNNNSPAALWKRLQDAHEEERRDVKRQRLELEQEKERMGGVNAEPTDIVEINAGGTIIVSHRATLCLVQDSMFSHLFSGRWDESWARDEKGRIFLDHDPELVQILVNHLRIKRIEDPSRKIRSPVVPENKQEEFKCLLRYLGLEMFFYPKKMAGAIDFSKEPLHQSETNAINILEQSEHRITMSFGGRGQCTGTLALGEMTESGYSWKVSVGKLQGVFKWLLLGVNDIAPANAPRYGDPTCFGWASLGNVYAEGKATARHGWSGFTEGESLFFKLADRKLSMYRATRDRTYSLLGVDLGTPFLRFNFDDTDAQITVSNWTAEDHETIGPKME